MIRKKGSNSIINIYFKRKGDYFVDNKYYLYIEDSGKFKNPEDNHIVYSFILFDKKQRKKFNRVFEYNKKEITEKKEIKGKEFLEKLNSKSKEPIKKSKFELMIKSGGEATLSGSIIWCKEQSKYEDLNISDWEEIDKKIWMISTIIKKIRENNKISDFSHLNIFLDNEPLQKPEYIMSKLNEDYSHSGIIRYLRAKKIRIDNVKFLDSKESSPIQYIDILAHATYKIFDNPTKVKLFADIIDLYIDGLYIIFQGFDCKNKLNDIKCNCKTMENV